MMSVSEAVARAREYVKYLDHDDDGLSDAITILLTIAEDRLQEVAKYFD